MSRYWIASAFPLVLLLCVAGAEAAPRMLLVIVVNEQLDCAMELDNGIVAVISHHRVFTCRKANIREVLDTHWRRTGASTVPISYGNCLYLAGRDDGALEVFRISEKGRIFRTATLNKGGWYRVPMIVGDRLHDVARLEGKRDAVHFVYSLANPAVPVLLRRTPLPGMGTVARSFRVVGTRLYCATNGKLWAFEIADGRKAELLGKVSFDTHDRSTHGLMVEGGHAYLRTGQRFSTFDVSRPAAMRELLVQRFNALYYTSFGGKGGFFSIGNDSLSEFLYPGDRRQGAMLHTPVELPGACFVAGHAGGFVVARNGSLTARPFGGARPRSRVYGVDGGASIAAANDHLYALGRLLQVFDIRNPAEIREVRRLSRPVCSNTSFQSIMHRGCIYSNMAVLDVRQPGNPLVLEAFRPCKSLSIRGNLLYRLTDAGYEALRIREGKPMRPLHAGTFEGKEEPRHVLVTGGHVFVAFGRKRMACYAIGKDYSLSLLSSFDLPGKDPYPNFPR